MLEGYRNKVEFTVGRSYKPLAEGVNPLDVEGDITKAC